MSDDRKAVLEVQDLHKTYYHMGKDVAILRGVDFTVERGDLVSIVGKSGVGKSTLLHVAGTLDKPTSGRVLYNGQDVFAMSEKELANFRNQQLGFVFQFHHLLPEFTALENVMLPALIGRIDFTTARERAESLLLEVGLKERLTHRPGELSGGEQQRVAIARALVMEPRLVFADEPTGNLDERTSDGVHELLFRLNAERQLAFVVVTHSFALARRMSRHVVMRDGQMFIQSEVSD
jgi:lipoprotein-releasing system ATP-binding protein